MPDLVITEALLAQKGRGTDLIRKAREKRTDFRVVYLTTQANTDMLGKDKADGLDLVLVKPMRKRELLQALRVALRR